MLWKHFEYYHTNSTTKAHIALNVKPNIKINAVRVNMAENSEKT